MRALFINPFVSNWVEGKLDKSLTAVRLAPIGILVSRSELGLSGAEIARHPGVNTSSINRAPARQDEAHEGR